MSTPQVEPVEAFDLPDWLGEEQVTWVAVDSVGTAHHVHGTLSAGSPGSLGTAELGCDVLAGDHAYPAAVVDEATRRDLHQAWALGQVLLVALDDRLTLAVPGSVVDAEVVMEALRRLAKAVGAPSSRFAVSLRL